MENKKEIQIKSGDVVTFLAMEWREENWEFDFPSMLVEPVVKWYESGTHTESVIEDAVIDACVDEKLVGEEVPGFRGNLQYLRRVVKQVQAGKQFPVKSYRVRREVHRFFGNDQNELESETIRIEEWD